MTDQTGDRPEDRPERRLPARREPSDTLPARSAERFTAPRQTRAISGLTSERAAKIVRQSGDARWVAFLGMVIVALFVIVYYFYELGVPIINTEPRLAAQDHLQQVTAVERGYNLYQANCASCHGVNGEGGIGPILNDQSKLFAHLSEQYLHNVLTVGGRYVCGNPKSLMPVWSEENNGPLNYIQIEDLIAFIRAPSTQEYQRRDPELNEPVLGPDGKVLTFKGWRDEAFRPEPSATPVPDCWLGDAATPGPTSTGPAASVDPNRPVVTIVATNPAQFDTQAATVQADTEFTLVFDNQDATAPHNVVVNDPAGEVVDIGDNPFFTGPEQRTYNYPALAAGAYPYFCQVHTNMTGTLTAE
jgi:mono/diheme cytochrome c family protein/plastocyanin